MAVEVGDQAPDFELRDQHGTPVRLSGFRGAKNVVLVFYPLAFSPVCSGELCAFRDEFPEVNRDDVELLTVSVDSTFTHRAWADAEHFQFGLLSDFWPHGEVAKQYGVFDSERGIATRGSWPMKSNGCTVHMGSNSSPSPMRTRRRSRTAGGPSWRRCAIVASRSDSSRRSARPTSCATAGRALR